MQLNPHLSFNGQCETAFRFYQKCLGGKIVALLPYGDTPMAEQVPPEWREKIVHATLETPQFRLTGADAFCTERAPYEKPRGFSVLFNPSSEAEAERIFASLSENAEIQMPLQKTFWAQRFGMLIDQFGIPWMVNCGDA